ncbi:MAG: hypothetical protein Q4F72_01860 [Desulfovibrionaceae bacterium]|nr:hypothetical protein [Desulfovibrionaceae bacterium]
MKSKALSACTIVLILALCLPLAACKEKSGPEKALDTTAKALKDKNSALFLNQLDINAFTYHELVNLRKDNTLLDLAGNLGSLLGIDNQLQELLVAASSLKEQYISTFTRTVNSGELPAHCSRSLTADCPWDPAGLEKAEVQLLDENAAIARVTTSANITSWVALRKKGEAWAIVGKAPSQETATLFAKDSSDVPQAEEQPVPVMPGTERPADTGAKAEKI